MNPERSKLQQQREQVQDAQSASRQNTVREFASVEELLRHDAAQISPPPGLAARVNDSLASEPRPVKSWWKRLFSR
jgi:hypothetical protein